MGKGSPKNKELKKNPRQQKRKSRAAGKKKYLRPGALAQLRYGKAAAAARYCTDLGKKRIGLLDVAKKAVNNESNRVIIDEEMQLMVSPDRCRSVVPPVSGGAFDLSKQSMLLSTPKTPLPVNEDCQLSDSRLEGLPYDLLVKILCHLHHDQLRAVFHVSRRVRKAVITARQLHFNYKTPDRSRQEMLQNMTPLPTEHWPFVSKEDGVHHRLAGPHTPKAPRHGPRPPLRLKCTEMKQITAVLFQEPSFPSSFMVPSVLSKPPCKNRILFYEDELCQAVAQNKLR